MRTRRRLTNLQRTRNSSSSQYQWRRNFDRIIRLYRLAGVPETEIDKAARASLARHRRTRAVKVPPVEVLLYSEVISVWKYERRFLDDEGQPKALSLDGRNSFTTLVARTGIAASPTKVLRVLARLGIVRQGETGLIRLLVEAMVPRGTGEQAERLGYGLLALNSLLDTLSVSVLSSPRASIQNRVQRMAWTQDLDPRYLADYDRFQRETVEAFLDLQEAWLKRHRSQSHRGKRIVGLQVNGFLLQLKS